MLTRTVFETRICGRLANRGCQVISVYHYDNHMVVYYLPKKGKIKRQRYNYRKDGAR